MSYTDLFDPTQYQPPTRSRGPIIPPPPPAPPTPPSTAAPTPGDVAPTAPVPQPDPLALLRPPRKPPPPGTAGATWRSVPGEPGGGYWEPSHPPPLEPSGGAHYTWRSVPGEPGGGYWEPPRPPPLTPTAPGSGQPFGTVPTPTDPNRPGAAEPFGAPPPQDPDPPPGSWKPDTPGGGQPGTGRPFGQPGYNGAPDWRRMQPWQIGNDNFRTPVLKLISTAEAGGRNVEGKLPIDRAQGSSGYFQISDATWRQFCNLANACRWSRAIDAPAQVQAAVAWNIPLGRWTTKGVVKQQYPWATDQMTLGQIAQRAGGSLAANNGQPEPYIFPREGRGPQEWGQHPEYNWSPGHMPMAHDIPNIMQSILPLIFTLFSGFTGFAGTAMLTAFGSYQNARNRKNELDAKQQKTYWRDSLDEMASRMQQEAMALRGVYAAHDPTKDPNGFLAAAREVANTFQDHQMMAAVESGDPAAIQRLGQERDKWFQTISKTNAAQTKADQQAAQTAAQIGAETAPYSSTAPAGAPAEPASPLPPGQVEAGAGGPYGGWAGEGAGTSAGPPTPPSAAGTSAPAPSMPAAPSVTPRPAADTTPPAAVPAETPPPGEPSPGAPAAAPQPAAAGLPAPDLPPQLQQGVTGLSSDRLDQDARQYLESQKPIYNPHTDPLGTVRNEAVARRASQMQAFIDNAIRAHRPGDDPEKLFRRIDSVDPGMAGIVRNVDAGEVAPPSGWQLRTPLYQNVMKLVTAGDPQWSGTRWYTNYRTKVGFSVGTQSTQVTSANRALQHMTVLIDAANQLGNTNFTDVNALRNFLRTHAGSDAVTNFDIAREHVAQELERVFRGGSGAASEIKRDLDLVGSSASPAQIKGYIRTITELLKGQLDAMADLYQRGTRKPTTGDSLLSPGARATYTRILGVPLGTGGAPVSPSPEALKDVGSELDSTATPPPSTAYGPGPAPVEGLPPGWTETQ